MAAAIFTVSASVSLIISAALLLIPLLDKRYNANWRYVLWLILALRLLIPCTPSHGAALIKVSVPEHAAVTEFRRQQFAPTAAQPAEHPIGLDSTEAAAGHSLSYSYTDIISCIWAAGAAVFFLYHICAYIHFRLKIRGKLKPTDKKSVYTCQALSTPLVTGFIKPIILLPEHSYTEEEMGFILAHENTHKKRGDLWYKLLLVAANSLHWFNPLVYLMVKQAVRDLEYSCDSIVVQGRTLDYRKKYSLTILKYSRQNRDTKGDK